MLEFRTPVLSDKARIDSFVKDCGGIGCDLTSTNTYLWREHYDIRVAFTDDSYFKCYYTNGGLSGYTLPLTKGDLRAAVDAVIADARERGVKPLIGLLSDENAALLKEMYGDSVDIKHDRDSFDYIYDRHALASLSGKKYHAKRNHVSRFFRTYFDVSVEEICELNFGDVLDIAERWQANSEDTGELDIIRDALEHFDELGMFGLLLYVDEKPVAMSIGSRISDEVCDVNFEKAVDIDEAYAVINNEFAKHYDSFTYLNREEDMGMEGLRKSKLSYHPDILYAKSTAVFK